MGSLCGTLRISAHSAILVSLISLQSTFADLPGLFEQDRSVQCGNDKNGHLDFTSWTQPPNTLPDCLETCPDGRITIGDAGSENGDVPSCVWPPLSDDEWSLRFVLHERYRESDCEWIDQWDRYRQMASAKVAQILGVPLSEVRSAFLYWVVSVWPLSDGEPTLVKFIVARKGEADFPNGTEPTRRLAAETFHAEFYPRRAADADPWYLLYLAFRVDSKRIGETSRGVDLFRKNNKESLQEHFGIPAEVTFFEMELSDLAQDDNPVGEYVSVYQFGGYAPNLTPGRFGVDVGGVAGRGINLWGCLTACDNVVDELFNSLGPRRCLSDCDCNGERWCGHLGVCSGETIACILHGDETSTATSTTIITSTKTTVTHTSTTLTTTIATTTTKGPAQLSDLGTACYETITEAWNICTVAGGGVGCNSLACVVLRVATDSSACREEVCNSTGSERADIWNYWMGICADAAPRAAFRVVLERPCHVATSEQLASRSVNKSADAIGLGVFIAMAITPCLGFLAVGVAFLVCRERSERHFPASLIWLLENPCVVAFELRWACLRKCCPCCLSRRARLQYAAKHQQSKRTTTPPYGTPRSRTSGEALSNPTFTNFGDDYPSHGWSPSPPHASPPSTPVLNARQAWRGDSPITRSRTAPETSSSGSRGWPWARSSDRTVPDDTETGPCESPTGVLEPRALASELHNIRRAASDSPNRQRLFRCNSPRSLVQELRHLRGEQGAPLGSPMALPPMPSAERRRIFKELVLRWHPDKNAGKEQHAAEMFQALQESRNWFLADD